MSVKFLTTSSTSPLPGDLQKIVEARHHAPSEVLGLHRIDDKKERILVFRPGARSVRIGDQGPVLRRLMGSDLFTWSGAPDSIKRHYRIRWIDHQGKAHNSYDVYDFKPQLSDYDLHLFGAGKHWHLYRILGAHLHQIDSIKGVLFSTWAPNAERVSVIGDFNNWDGRVHPMTARGNSGIWELFVPELGAGMLYKFEIRNRDSGAILTKSDPYARQFEMRPRTSSIVAPNSRHAWNDAQWLSKRETADWQHQPMSIYEVHLGSWQRNAQGGFLNYRELAERLVDYAKSQGFTHIELLPITEHPLDASWGYQTTGYFAPTSRFGTADEFRYLVDRCHRQGLGVILDWVPAHFPKDSHGLAHFDGTALYEHADPRRGEHRDWGTLIYNYGRNEVKNLLLASAMFWLEEFHIDGLRVDAVASMLYLDYSREEGDWMPNIHGGNENLEAIEFLRELNNVTQRECPGSLIIAEESTAWPQVTRPSWLGGLGYAMKWNMGWMHDTLIYMSKDPIHRHYHQDQLTFGLLYSFTENFVLPFSHDEVVHGKGSMLSKMPGDQWQRFANLRLLYTYMFTYPGKKLLFMGNEFAQPEEWKFDQSLDWQVLEAPLHRGLQSLVSELNRLYRERSALHYHDFNPEGFEWIDCHDAVQSVLSYQRKGLDELAVVVLNFTPVPRHAYRLGVPKGGIYRERLNSDSSFFGGSNVGNTGEVVAEPKPWMGHPWSLNLTLPPLAGLILTLDD
ncbi:MAG: 1,4-alpha-glucan branching protein GlgB [Pseudomonadota bacterium]